MIIDNAIDARSKTLTAVKCRFRRAQIKVNCLADAECSLFALKGVQSFGSIYT